MVDAVVGRYLDCGVLEAGFVRVRCEDCRAEYLRALNCKTRYFCPSCHAKRLACWTQRLGEGNRSGGRLGCATERTGITWASYGKGECHLPALRQGK